MLRWVLQAGLDGGAGADISQQVDRVKEGVKLDCKEPVFETGLVKKTAHCPCKWAAPGNKMTLCCCFLIHVASRFPFLYGFIPALRKAL